MRQWQLYRWRLDRYLLGLLAVILCIGLCGTALTRADTGEAASPAWAAPATMAIRKVSPVDTSQHEPVFLNNLDCNALTYRISGSTTMQAGCFTPTAFGLMDSDSGTVLFNGTDEGLPLVPYTAHESLIPWPKALDLVALDASSTIGSYISLYKNPLAVMRDERDASFKLTAKILTAPPELPIKDTAGKQLLINPQTMAFSDNGSWLVVETLNGSFVRINLATLDITAFAPSFGSQGSPALLKSRVAVTDDGRYIAIANAAAGSLKVYDLTACGSNVPVATPSYACPGYDYSSFVERQINGFQAVRHMRFVNNGLLSFEAQTSDPASSGIYELAPTDKITSLIDYLALGDSYTSGEGAFDYLDGTDTPGDMCHLSAHAYPLLLTHDLFSEAGGHSVACSGATINDVGSTSPGYRGQVRGGATLQQLQQAQSALLNAIMANYTPGYVAQQRFARQYQPAVMTVSVGGDDIGFGDIVQKCVLPHVSLHHSDSDCYNTYEDRLELTRLVDRTVPRWTALYKELRSEAPSSRVYVVGYPDVVTDTGDCALNVHLSKGELEFIQEMTVYLDDSIHQAAINAGVVYIDVSQALAGHRLCETASYNVAVNGLTAGTDAGIFGLNVFGKESYHPNALGQALLEQAILKQTHNLTDTLPVNSDNSPDNQTILNAPKTGRAVNNLMPDDSLTPGTARAGQTITVQADGSSNGLKPNTVYTVRLDGPGGVIIGTATSDSSSDIAASATIPGNTSSGSHTVDITGEDQADEPIDITQPVYVPVSDSDADGDGTPDVLDTCPGAVNSGQDSDQDGTDDGCDPVIGSVPAGPDQGGASGTGSGAGLAAGNTMTAGSVAVPAASAEANTGSVADSVPAAKPANPISPAAKVLGAATIDPAVKPVKSLRLTSGNLAAIGRSFQAIHVIRWWLWILLPAIIWFLVFVVLLMKRYTNAKNQAAPQTPVHKNVSKLSCLNYNMFMIWVRKGFVHFLSVVLLLCLVGGAFAVSAKLNLTHPDKLEGWLSQSNFYSSVVTNELHDAQQSASNDAGAGRVSLGDPAIEHTVKSVFSPQLLKQYTDTILASNYGWLEGKTASPAFTIDLTAPKQELAQKVGQLVQTRVASLPACSAAQLAQLQTTLDSDPLSIPCQLPTLNPQTAAAQATAQINGSSNFLNNPVITANALNPNGSNQGQSYYQKLAHAPKLYQWAQRLPWIFGILALLSVLGIVFIAPGKRRGIRRIGIVILEAGIILVAVKFVADSAFNRLEKHIFNNSSIGQLQQSLTDFLHRIEIQLVRVDLWFGIGFLVVGVLILGALWFTRNRSAKSGKKAKPKSDDNPPGTPQTGDRPPLPVLKQPPRPRPPRLIQ